MHENSSDEPIEKFFHPDKNLILRQICSPTNFYGGLQIDDKFILTHTFATDIKKQFENLESIRENCYTPFSRGYYLLGIRSTAFSDDSPDEVFRRLLVGMSVRFGKRFDDMGVIIRGGHYSPSTDNKKPYTPFIASGFWNNYSRIDYSRSLSKAGEPNF